MKNIKSPSGTALKQFQDDLGLSNPHARQLLSFCRQFVSVLEKKADGIASNSNVDAARSKVADFAESKNLEIEWPGPYPLFRVRGTKKWFNTPD